MLLSAIIGTFVGSVFIFYGGNLMLGGKDKDTKNEQEPPSAWLVMLIGITLLFLGMFLSYAAGSENAKGVDTARADQKIRPGQMFECVSNPTFCPDDDANSDTGSWIAFVQVEGQRQVLALNFEDEPPVRGMAATQDGKTVFFPLPAEEPEKAPNKPPPAEPAHSQ